MPGFVEQRTLPDSREDLQERLEELGLSYSDRFEFMCLTHRCGPSHITVECKE